MVIMLIACTKSPILREYIIEDASKSTSFVLSTNDSTKSVYSISILIKYQVDSDASIELADGNSYSQKIVLDKNKTELRIKEDWYSLDCEVNYNSQNVEKGVITIGYEFYTL